jgi:hypothetical protein
MTAQEETARTESPHGPGSCSQPLLITIRAAAWWRPLRSHLAKRQVAAEHGKSHTAKSLCQRYQKRSIAVRPRAVGQYKAIASRINRAMQKSSHRHFIRRIFTEFLTVTVTHPSPNPH